MDPLSDVLRRIKPRSSTVGATDVGGPVAIRFPRYDGAFCYSVAGGTCWLQVEGEAEPSLLNAGDCVVLTGGRPFLLTSDPAAPEVAASEVFDHRGNGSIATWNGGGSCTMFAAHFDFEPGLSQFLLGVLPCVVRISDAATRAALRLAIEQMIDELQRGQPGGEVIVEHLAHITLIKVLRGYLAEGAGGRVGWLFALAEPRLLAAVEALHGDPSRAWTVEALARQAGMSRTSFAVRFRAVAGMPPMEYATRLRMLIAADLLASPGARVSQVGRSLGYESESAFSTAFRRVMGSAPRRYHGVA